MNKHILNLGAAEFPPRWSNRKAVLIGYLAGKGYSSVGIETHLGDGTIAASIRVQLQRAGIRRAQGDSVAVHLAAKHLGRLGHLAEAREMEPAEWLRQIAIAAIRDNLFDAVVDAD